MPRTKKKFSGTPTIDVSLVVIRTGTNEEGLEIALDTSNKVTVEPQTETVDAIKLVKLGRVIAQKPATTTVTGYQIILTDNVFTPLLAKILMGGTITGEGDSLVYQPPVSGSSDKGEVFELETYSAVYDSSGQIEKYEVITYPNCQGTPFTINIEDDVFRVSEYTIQSAPKTGEAPYKRTYVTELPDFSSVEVTEDGSVSEMSMLSESGTNAMPVSRKTKTTEVSVNEAK